MIDYLLVENLIWSQMRHLPNKLKFLLVLPPEASTYSYMWYDNGRMRATGGAPRIALPESLNNFYSTEIKLRGAVLSAGSFIELLVEQIVYIDIGAYEINNSSTKSNALEALIGTKLNKRTEYLKDRRLLQGALHRKIKEFMKFRDIVAHSYTLQDLEYKKTRITPRGWQEAQKAIKSDFNFIWLNLSKVLLNSQDALVIYLVDKVRSAQIKEGVVYPLNTIVEGKEINVDLRSICDIGVYLQNNG